METVLLVVAGGAVCLAILIAIVNKMKGTPAKEERPAGSMYFAPIVPVAPVAMGGARFQANAATDRAVAERAKKRKQRNKRGWRAPAGHYFDDNDCLYTDAGDAILDMIMIAKLCDEGLEPCEESEEIAPLGVSSECAAASCCSEASAEVTSKTDFSSLQTETTCPEPSYSAPEPSYSGGDDGGGDDGGGDD